MACYFPDTQPRAAHPTGRTLNILHLLSQTQLTGAEVYAVTLAHEQIKNRHRVFQISNGFYTTTPAEKHCLDVECHHSADRKKNIQWLSDFIEYNAIHIVHSHSRAAAKMATQAIKKLPSKLKVGHVSSIHGHQKSSFSKKLFNHYGNFQIAICDEIKKHLILDYGYNERRISVIANPIDLNKFFWCDRQQTLKNKKNLKVAIIGRTNGPKKTRTELALKQFSQLAHDNNLKISWTLIGGKVSDINLDLKDISIEEEVIDQITSEHLKGFDFLIGSGRVAIEGLITGVPVIAFGEATYEGVVTLANFDKIKQSNFGDIHHKLTKLSIDSELAKKDFKLITSDVMQKTDLLTLSQKTVDTYNVKTLYPKIHRLYESALLLSIYSKWIPILMYHKIPNQEINSSHRIFVTKENFVKHLLFFKKNKFTTLDFQDLKDFSCGAKPAFLFPKKPLILTFDDGYLDNLENASPLLKQLGFKAEIFLLADPHIKSNVWDTQSSNDAKSKPNEDAKTEPISTIVSGHDRKQWLLSAFSIGSHGWRHDRITQMTMEKAKEELVSSKKSLENEFGKPVVCFAYTYGDTSSNIADLAAAAGYDFAVNTDTGGLLLQEDPYQIFRVNIFPEDTVGTLKKKTSSWYRRYYFWKRRK